MMDNSNVQILYFIVCRSEEIFHPTTPNLLDEEGGILNLAENEVDVDEEDEVLAVNQSYDEGMKMQEDAVIGDELDDVENPAEYESGGVVQEDTNAGTKEVHHKENTERDFQVSVVETSFSAHDVGDTKTEGTVQAEGDSPINRIHSEILELTRKISMPEAGILNLIRAAEEAQNEAKRQQEAAVAASSPSKESLLLKAMAEHGSGDFSIQGAFRGLSPRDLKQISTGPHVSKSPTITTKATLQGDEGGKASVGDKESLGTSTKKDITITLNSEMGAPDDVSVKPQIAEELSQTTDKGTETRKSEMTDRDMLGLVKIIHYQTTIDRNIFKVYVQCTILIMKIISCTHVHHEGCFPYFDQIPNLSSENFLYLCAS